MAQPVEAGVLKVFDVDGGHLVHRRVALLPQAEEKIFDKRLMCSFTSAGIPQAGEVKATPRDFPAHARASRR